MPIILLIIIEYVEEKYKTTLVDKLMGDLTCKCGEERRKARKKLTTA
jgi:hypothetical protein